MLFTTTIKLYLRNSGGLSMGRQREKIFNVIDLFCGAGGLSLGFQQAGFKVILGIDNNQQALMTFRNNHKSAISVCGDISKLDFSKDIKPLLKGKEIDVIIGGPPCQGFSISGFRNFNDPRNKLYLSYIRFVKDIRPKFFIIENVPGLVNLFNGKVKDRIIEEFKKLGYQIEYKILSASDYGVPQNRKRVFFVGHFPGFSFAFPPKSDFRITSSMALSDLPPLKNELGTNGHQNYYLNPQNNYQILMRKNSNGVFNHLASKHADRVKKIIALVPPGGNYKDLPPSIRSLNHFHVAWTRWDGDKPAPTIDTGHRHHFHYLYNRVPTVRECARIQSFPDDFIFTGTKTQQMLQVGNAVPPLLAEAIAKEVMHGLKK